MRPLMPLLAAVALVLSTAAGHAVLGDQLFKLLPDDGAEGDWFGWSVAISGDVAIVGAYGDDDNGWYSGSAYLFDATTGQQLAKLMADDGATEDRFGMSVGISGDTAIVGARSDDDNGTDSGSAYLFDTTTGQQIAKLLPDDGEADDHFGKSVAISGDLAIVGAIQYYTGAGAAYLFDTSTGQQIAKLTAEDGANSDSFGNSVAISGATAVIGAFLDDDNGTSSGSAYLFDISDPANPMQLFKLLPDDGAAFDSFGWSVAISGEIIIIGGPFDDDNGSGSGSAYLFDTTTGQQITKLLPADGAAEDHFGESVAISGDICIVGAHLDDSDQGSSSGSAYLFDVMMGEQIHKLIAKDAAESDQFGRAVSISGVAAIIGAIGDDDNGYNSGSAYLFDAAGCPEDPDGSGLATLCHIPPGNPDNAHTITVGVNAAPAHLAHGDHCGPCEEDDGLLLRGGGDAGHDPCSTDLDDSGDVGVADLAELLGAWGPKPGHPVDLDGDGDVDAADLATLLGNWGPCP